MTHKVATYISRAFFIIGILACFVIIAGFFRFCDVVTGISANINNYKADGIVSLTGGSDKRLKEAVSLLEMKKGQRLLISGVYPRSTTEEVRKISGGSKELFNCCVDLGKKADDTIGNAQEIKEWVNLHKYKSIVLVTDNYHIPRSMLEVSHSNPNIKIYPYPVRAAPFDQKDWWENNKELRGLLTEYTKYVFANMRMVFRLEPGK